MVKMVGRSVNQKDEKRADINARSKLRCSLKQLMTELSTTYGPSCVSYDTVRRWKNKFESGVESIKIAQNASLWITVCHHSTSLVMPNGDPRDGFFYPTLTLMIHVDS